MMRNSIQVDPKFKEMLERMKHEYCIQENKNISLREFTKILYENKIFEEKKQIKEEALQKLMKKLKKS